MTDYLLPRAEPKKGMEQGRQCSHTPGGSVVHCRVEDPGLATCHSPNSGKARDGSSAGEGCSSSSSDSDSWVVAGPGVLSRGVSSGVELLVKGIWGMRLSEQQSAAEHLATDEGRPGRISPAHSGGAVPLPEALRAQRPSLRDRLAAAAASLAGDGACTDLHPESTAGRWHTQSDSYDTGKVREDGHGSSQRGGQDVPAPSKRRAMGHGTQDAGEDKEVASKMLQAAGGTAGLLRAGVCLHGQAPSEGLPPPNSFSELTALAGLSSLSPTPTIAGDLRAPDSRCPSPSLPVSLPVSSYPVGEHDVAEREISIVRKRLLRLAVAVEQRDLEGVQSLLQVLKPYSNKRGRALQRMVFMSIHCLMLRLTGMATAQLKKPPKAKPQDVNKAILWMLRAFPLPTLNGVALAGMLLHRLVGQKHIHVIGMGQRMVALWPLYIKFLASQPGQPLKHLRITWLDSSLLVNPWREQMNGLDKNVDVVQGLRAAAEEAGVGFSFEHVALQKNSLHMLYDIRRRERDTLVFSIAQDLMYYPAEMHPELLQWMRLMEPETVAMSELDLAATSSSLLPRFASCFDFYHATFSMHDACTHAEDRAPMLLLEDLWFVSMMTRIVACQGGDRVCQPAGSASWMKMFQEAGFRRQKLSDSMLDAAYDVVRRFSVGFGLTLVDETLSLTWRGAPISFWVSWGR